MTKDTVECQGLSLIVPKAMVAWLRHESKRRGVPQWRILYEAVALLDSRQLVYPTPPKLPPLPPVKK